MISRREFFVAAVGASATSLVVARVASAQQGAPPTGTLFQDMDQGAAESVRRPAKPGAKPVLTDAERDDVERKLVCTCRCRLNVYTCRTTDPACQVSPAMHRDVVALVEGGYSAQEIIDAFVETYGERVLTAPPARGFNLVGYVMPFLALTAGAVVLVTLLRRWRLRAERHEVALVPASPDVAADDMARLNAAIRDDG
jgi:cytochrome c-type biogenesis protein CcmH